MHELGLLIQALGLALGAAEGAGATRINRVQFAMLEGGHLSRDSVQTLFGAISHGTIAEGAAIDVERNQGQWVCLTCAAAPAPWPSNHCPTCDREGRLTGAAPELALVAIDVSITGAADV
jgi:hydrogenase nickel incorporation protein HypA/HybF